MTNSDTTIGLLIIGGVLVLYEFFSTKGKDMDDQLWEFLLPVEDLTLVVYWKERITEITGNETVFQSNGQTWNHFVPVRVACNELQLDEVVELTLKYFDQEKIIVYKVSNDIRVREKKVGWKNQFKKAKAKLKNLMSMK